MVQAETAKKYMELPKPVDKAGKLVLQTKRQARSPEWAKQVEQAALAWFGAAKTTLADQTLHSKMSMALAKAQEAGHKACCMARGLVCMNGKKLPGDCDDCGATCSFMGEDSWLEPANCAHKCRCGVGLGKLTSPSALTEAAIVFAHNSPLPPPEWEEFGRDEDSDNHWPELEDWDREGLREGDGLDQYLAVRSMLQRRVSREGVLRGKRIAAHLLAGTCAAEKVTAIAPELLWEMFQGVESALYRPDWDEQSERRFRDKAERGVEKRFSEAAPMYVKQGVHAHAGHPPDAIERDAELFVWNSLMMVVKGPELAEALEFSNPTQQERPGSLALELLDFHFDLQEGRGGSDSEEANGQVTPPRGLDLRTAMGAGFEPDQTASIERANCMACVECGRDSTRILHRVPRNAQDSRGKIFTSCLDCLGKLPTSETWSNDLYEAWIDPSLMNAKRGARPARVKSSKVCTKCRHKLPVALTGDAVYCAGCTKESIDRLEFPSLRPDLKPCSWCRSTTCHKVKCAPPCPICEEPADRHKLNCSLAPAWKMPRKGDGLRGHGMDKRPSTPCQCVLSASEANRVGAESKPGENAAEHLHWRTCLKRQERVQVSAEGPSLRIDAAEPKDFIEDLEAG
jgi:hypothetical protein